jgi:hypothetical protein
VSGQLGNAQKLRKFVELSDVEQWELNAIHIRTIRTSENAAVLGHLGEQTKNR